MSEGKCMIGDGIPAGARHPYSGHVSELERPEAATRESLNEYHNKSAIDAAFEAMTQDYEKRSAHAVEMLAKIVERSQPGDTVTFQVVTPEGMPRVPVGDFREESAFAGPGGCFPNISPPLLQRIPISDDDLSGETTVVDETTGGMKGQKLARFDMIPPDVLWELAEHFGKGEAKYPSDENGLPNWQRGYSWRLSVAALLRHFFAFLKGEDIDPETGSSHLIAVVWHAMALRWFQLHGKGKDYR